MTVFVAIWIFMVVLGLTAVGALVWAIQSGQLRNISSGAKSIFDDDEPMAVSDVSIAAAWGTDFASDTADIVWLQRDVASIVSGVRVCRHARSVIISNLFLAAAYNIVGISLAATGFLHPIAAAILMLASSLTVTLRASSITAH